MPDLSIIIPGRNEMFIRQTVENVLANIRGDSEVIAVLDAYWPETTLQDHPRLKVIHHTEAVGQRAATNDGAKLSRAKFVMKLDAHCSVDTGFDVKLMADCQPDWCLVPAMHHLHAFDWQCKSCGRRTYQGSKPIGCKSPCKSTEFEMVLVWKPKHNKPHVSYRFDKNLQFQYWGEHAKRPECQGPLVETMSFIGACMFLEREQFWKLGGMDEGHGSWGQFGTEFACKSWLSGGKLMASRNTWFAHMFRTGNFAANGHSTWPYPMSQEQIERAREHSRNLWLNDSWPLQVHPLNWLVEKFKPVPGWE